MAPQWNLILSAMCVCAAAGLFAVGCAHALKGGSERFGMPMLVASTVLLVAGTAAMSSSLQHWERAFNAFGNLGSAITQELIAIVAMLLLLVVSFVLIHRGADRMPAWLSACGIAVGTLLVLAVGRSYMMVSRAAWSSAVQTASLFGYACAIGIALYELVRDDGQDGRGAGLAAACGINAATASLFVAGMAAPKPTAQLSTFDMTRLVKQADNATEILGGNAPLIIAVAFAVAAFLVALVATRKAGRSRAIACLVAVLVVVGAIALRVAMYATGAAVTVYR